ncbi:MAG: hypothetical protein IJV69_08090 [Kiritimatiellae bacterium]|nr:hypothetical protein [Kiritimatiellia bacterium]
MMVFEENKQEDTVHEVTCTCGCADHEDQWGHDHACDCGEADCCCDDEPDYDLRYVSDTQLACSGEDLTELLNFDADVDEALYAKLGLTAVLQQAEDFEFYTFEEILPECYYMITFPPETNFADFTVAQALSIEEMTEQRFQELELDDSEMACDGNCDCCDQDCIGKQPVL